MGRYMLDRITVKIVYFGHSATRINLEWREWHCDRFIEDRVSL
jgi:hypothetical protein